MYGLLGGSALLLGALLGMYLKISRRTIAVIMAFGSGVLLCTLAFDLMEDAYAKGGFDSVTVGFLTGALLYVAGDLIVNRSGGHYRKDTLRKRHIARKPELAEQDSGMAIFIGALLDGVPESFAIGIGLLAGKGFGFIMVIAVFLSNLPEGISGAVGMMKANKSKRFILSMWIGVTLLCGLSSVVGYHLLGKSSPGLIAAFLALAAGAILAMLSATMIPEAFDDEGRITPIVTPLVTVAGFLLAFIISHAAR